MPMPYGDFGKILVPVYLGYYSELPEADRNPNPFARLRKRVFSSRVYFYEPKIENDKGVLITRTLNNNSFVDDLKKKINFRANEQIFTITFEKQSFEDITNGRFKVLLSHENERKFSKNYYLEVTSLIPAKWEVRKLDSSITMSNYIIDRAIDLRQNSLYENNLLSTISGFEKMSSLNWEQFTIDRNESIEETSVTQTAITDTLEYPIKTYVSDDSVFKFFQTPSKIFAQIVQGNEQKTLSFPAHISSFLSGTLFREQHFPIVLKGDNKSFPALFVDATQVATKNIYIIKADGNELTAPIKFNVNIPDGCKSLNPSLKDGDIYRYSLYCATRDGKVKFIFVPLEE